MLRTYSANDGTDARTSFSRQNNIPSSLTALIWFTHQASHSVGFRLCASEAKNSRAILWTLLGFRLVHAPPPSFFDALQPYHIA